MKEVAILPEQAPVMPLPGAVLFPHALLPLYIFELRYREMLAHALAQERMFCVALLRPESAQWKSEDDFFDIGTIGLIRACVGRGEGTSNLILQGLQRVRFADFVQLDPFPIAELETLRSDDETTVETDALGAKVLELYARFKTLGRQLPTKIDRSCRRCNRTPCDATLRSRSAEPPHLQAGLDRAGNFRKLFATSRTRVCLPPPPAGGNKHSDTKISGARDWPLPDRHHIE